MDEEPTPNEPARDVTFARELVASVASARFAVARSRVTMLSTTTTNVASNTMKKGDVLATARLAGVQAAKQAASLLPLVIPVTVSSVEVNFVIGDTTVDVEARVDCFDRSGAEAQALSAVTVAALTIYDMCKSADRTMSIGAVALWEKSDGHSDHWRRGEVHGSE